MCDGEGWARYRRLDGGDGSEAGSVDLYSTTVSLALHTGRYVILIVVQILIQD